MKNSNTYKTLGALVLMSTLGCSPAFVEQQSLNDEAPLPKARVSVRSFDQVNETMSALTGVKISKLPVRTVTAGMVVTTGNDFIRPEGGGLKTELPSNNNLAEFNASHQGAIIRMAAIYCNEYINGERAAGRGPASVADLNTNIDSVVESYYDKFWGSCVVKPELESVKFEIRDLLGDLQSVQATNMADEYLKLTCSVFLSSSCTTMF
jgi:hypothetical protein